MEAQLSKVLASIVNRLNGEKFSSTGNLIIQGSQGCGKTVLATSIVKVLQMECGKPNGRIGKIDAEALNKKDLHQLLKKVTGGCLIIERAGEIDRTTAVSLSLLLEQEDSGLLVILEDSAIGIRKALSTDDGFAKKFTETVTVPIFTKDELVVFAESYANELGFVIEEMAILALHNRISNIEKLDQATTLVEIKEIIDEAIEREAHSGIRKAFNILTAKRYTDDDKIVLTEKDFE
jgi:ABC-type dipeptide/oligopeptide/nickel transport system ATPase component